MGVLAYHDRPYRPCVGIILINAEGQVFTGQRLDNAVEAWQMPQGGIDEGETPLAAAWREMREEIGTDKAQLIAEYPEWLNYDIPQPLADSLWGGRYRGQRQKWFVFRFHGTDSDINIATSEPEFRAWKWTTPDTLPALAVPFKRQIYETVLAYIDEILGKKL